MKTVVIPIETKSREFVGKVWLASNLVTEEINVILGDRRIIKKTIFDIDPAFYLAMGTAPQKRDLIERLSSNTIIGVLDSEGAPTQTDIVSMHDPECMEYVDIYFSWGREQAEKMKERFGRTGLDIAVTGTPEFDLLHDELKHIYAASQHTENLDDFVLVITSFATANHYNPKKRQHADSEKHKWQKAMIKSYESFVEEFIKGNDCTVVIRPHPIEDTDTYKKMFSGDDNAIVKYDGSVRYYIHKSSAVVHSGSTVGIESSIMGTPTIGLNTEDWYQPSKLPMDVSYEATSVSEAVELVNESINGPAKNIINIISLRNRIHNSQEPVSGETISDRITKAVTSKNNVRTNGTKHTHTLSEKLERVIYKKTTSDFIKNNSNYISHLDKILPGHNPSISGQRFQMFPGMTKREINELLGMLGVEKEISIERVGDYADMFKLQIE